MNDDPRVVGALRSSVLLAGVSALIHAVWRAVSVSRTAGAVRSVTRAWVTMTRRDRRLSIGVMLIACAVTHSVLVVANAMPPGWLWIVPPAAAASIGVLCMLPANGPRQTE